MCAMLWQVIVWAVLTVLQTLPFWQTLNPFWPQGRACLVFLMKSTQGLHVIHCVLFCMHCVMHAGSDDSLAWAAQAVTGGRDLGVWALLLGWVLLR